MTNDELVTGFEQATLGDGEFGHREHVRIAWCYLRKQPLLEALGRFAEGIQNFAVRKGADGLYNETLSLAFLLIVGERVNQDRSVSTWEEFAARNADLFNWPDSVLDRYYSRELLLSDKARRQFVLPDSLTRP